MLRSDHRELVVVVGGLRSNCDTAIIAFSLSWRFAIDRLSIMINTFCSFTFCVYQASYNTDSEANEVSERILVVSPDDHASVGDDDVLQAADDGGGEGRVVAGAEDNREHQDEAKHAGEQELRQKYRVMPSFKLLKYIF